MGGSPAQYPSERRELGAEHETDQANDELRERLLHEKSKQALGRNSTVLPRPRMA